MYRPLTQDIRHAWSWGGGMCWWRGGGGVHLKHMYRPLIIMDSTKTVLFGNISKFMRFSHQGSGTLISHFENRTLKLNCGGFYVDQTRII